MALTSSSGTFASSSSDNNISIYTDNATGYTLGIKAKTAGNDNNALVYKENDVEVARIPSITSAVSATDYADSTYATTHDLNNTWGYKPSVLYNSSTETNDTNSNYLPAPTDNTTPTIIAKTTTANTNNTADEYNLAIGARIDRNTPPGKYSNTFVITVVANPVGYNISFNKGNTTATVSNLPSAINGEISDPTSSNVITIPSTVPTRTSYAFAGWCTTMPTTSNNVDSCSGTVYQAGANYSLDTTNTTNNTNIVLYAMWETPAVVFKVGDNIETIIVAANTSSKRPYYASGTKDIRFDNPTNGTTYTVTVVPKPNYKLDNWTTTKSTTGLASQTLLTTTYTVNGSETLTAIGTSGSYTAMRTFDNASCTVPTNVTDERDGKSYTVAPIGGYCYMLSNLRLDNTNPNGTQRELESTYSDITPNGTYSVFPMPTEDWTSGSQDYYCKAIMKHYDQLNGSEYRNEYYYNWYAARANPYVCTDPTTYTDATTTNDNKSLGSICPKNWTLPAYNSSTNDISYSSFNTSGNPGFLATSGYFYSGAQGNVGSYGYWWSSTRNGNNGAYRLGLRSGSANRSYYNKYSGFSVRCMRRSS